MRKTLKNYEDFVKNLKEMQDELSELNDRKEDLTNELNGKFFNKLYKQVREKLKEFYDGGVKEMKFEGMKITKITLQKWGNRYYFNMYKRKSKYSHVTITPSKTHINELMAIYKEIDNLTAEDILASQEGERFGL